MDSVVDIAIVGGGLTGASLGLALQGCGLRIAVIEAVAPKLDSPAHFDARVLALAEGSRRIYDGLGLWPALAPYATPIRHIHVSDRGHCGMARLHAEEEGVEALGQVMEMRDLGRVVFGALQKLTGLELLCPARVETLSFGAERAELGLSDGRRLAARLVVLADGGGSALPRRLGLHQRRNDYRQSALIANVTTAKPHQGWAYERFTDTGPLALLPMSQGRMSLVWTLRPEQVDEHLALDETAFLSRLQERFGWRMGRFLKAGERQAYPLALKEVEEQVRPRLVVLGNAAHTLHPIAGQGFNLSLRDVACLASVLREALQQDRDIGELSLLLDYRRRRTADQARTIAATDGLARLFANDFGPLVAVRNLGLKLVDRVAGMKSELAEGAMGVGAF
ncbi:MAG: 2-octaprenyl-6-methoxyphenyl hydroxylase [Gammaproteobacteria bacterium]|nr:2-octaprenyl-6-methoxyphenyl hydroxylase [Gammaproteobacteria bacterium]